MRRASKQGALRKQSIIDYARPIFFQQGYESTTMKDIARACGFEPPNIYNYFRSKEQLLYEVMRDAHGKALSVVKPWENDTTTSPVEQLRAVIKTSFEEVVNWTKSTRVTIESEIRHLTPAHRRKIYELRSEYDRCLRSIIKRGIASHDFAPVDDKITGFFIVSLTVRSVIWFSPQGELSASELADRMFNFVLCGLKGERGKPA